MFDTFENRLDRREFVKAAVAIGGASALAACTDLEGAEGSQQPQFPRGPDDLSTLSERMHYWDRDILVDMAGNTILPQHQLILTLEYTGSIPPTAAERETFEAAIQSLERAYQRGTDGDIGAQINEGLLFFLGYAPHYFDRFEEELPADLGLQRPTDVLAAVGESTEKAISADAAIIMSADFGSILLEAEQALFGERDTMNGLEMAANLSDLFERRERRTGFVGSGVPRERIEDPVADHIDDSAPMAMGFQSGFRDNLPDNDTVTLVDPPFVGGTTLMVSRLTIELDRWYQQDHEDRVELMFSTDHSSESVGRVGENLGDHSGLTKETVDSIEERAETTGRIGHTAKTGRARDEEFKPTIHRRSESIATDIVESGIIGFNFVSIQRDTQRFVEVRKAMNPDEYDVDVPDEQHGIIDYLETESRGTFLVPPRRLRALPTPQPTVDSYI